MAIHMKPWIGQISTIIGALIAAPVTVALLQHQITIEQAIPGLLAALVGLVWPENKSLATNVEATATQLVQLLPVVMAAYEHGKTAAAAQPAPASDHAGTQ